jgi:acyl carrier protein
MLGLLQGTPDIPLANLAYTLQHGREPLAYRLALIAETQQELMGGLTGWLSAGDNPEQLSDGITRFYGNLYDERNAIDDVLGGEAGKAFLKTIAGQRDFRKLALLWTKGVDIPWSLLNDTPLTMIALPLYPFHATDHVDFGSHERDGNDRANDAHEQKLASLPDRVYAHIAVFIREALMLGEEDVKPNRDVHSYGMDSIVMLRLRRDLEEQFGISVSASEFDRATSIGELARRIARGITEEEGRQRIVNDSPRLVFSNEVSVEVEMTTLDSRALLQQFKSGELTIDQARAMLDRAAVVPLSRA